MNGLELFLLGRTLMKIAEEAIPTAGSHRLPTTVRSVLLDVFEHPNSSIGEIAAEAHRPLSQSADGQAHPAIGDPSQQLRSV